MIRGRDKFDKYYQFLRVLSFFYSIFPKEIQKRILEKNRNKTGYIGLAKRYALVKNLAHSVGKNVSIREGVYLYNIEKLSIGDNVSIWPMTYIDAFGGVKMGNDISIAHGTSILSFEHSFTNRTIPIRDQQLAVKQVLIEDDVWIGAKATVLSGVTIESGCVIGANAIVTTNTSANGVYVGVPAKRIKDR